MMSDGVDAPFDKDRMMPGTRNVVSEGDWHMTDRQG